MTQNVFMLIGIHLNLSAKAVQTENYGSGVQIVFVYQLTVK